MHCLLEHRCTQGGGERVRSEKLSHKNAIKHEKGEKGDPLKFSDNPNYPPKKNLAKTPRTPLDSQLCTVQPQKKMNIHYLLGLSLALLHNCFFVFNLIMHIYIKTIADYK
jgi:hypothetical protein